MKAVCGVAVLLGIVIAILIYTRPLTIEERYPVLDVSQCTMIWGYCYVVGENGVEDTRFTMTPEDAQFEKLIALFQSTAFRTRLRNLLPHGTKYHGNHEGDFKWEVMLQFENVPFPSGDTGSGNLLRIENFFGDIELSFDGQETYCFVKNQDAWLGEVMTRLR